MHRLQRIFIGQCFNDGFCLLNSRLTLFDEHGNCLSYLIKIVLF